MHDDNSAAFDLAAFIEALEDLDDIQTVTTNVNLPDELTSA